MDVSSLFLTNNFWSEIGHVTSVTAYAPHPVRSWNMPTEQPAIGRGTGKRWLAAVCALAAATIGLTLSGSGNTAHAAVPDRFGFVLGTGAAPVGSGPWPAATTVSVLGPGRYLVKSPAKPL